MEVQKENILQEVLEFAVSIVWLAIAFGIFLNGGIDAFKDIPTLRTTILESLIIVLFAFVLHELAHRIAARRYGFHAVYHVWIPGLILAMGSALIGFLFAAPGAVHIQMSVDTAENRARLGKCSLAGPVVNLVLTVVFAMVAFGFVVFVRSYLQSTGTDSSQLAPWVNTFLSICVIGVEINAWLAFINLIPWGTFDGLKVYRWNKKVWLIVFIISIAMYGLVVLAQTNLLG